MHSGGQTVQREMEVWRDGEWWIGGGGGKILETTILRRRI
jgi:hypothetical protein